MLCNALRTALPAAAALSICAAAFADGPRYTIIDLGPIAPQVPGNFAEANAINNLGQVGGRSTNLSGDFEATLWLQEPAYGMPAGVNGLGDLGVPGGGRIYGMNDLGQCVGFTPYPSGSGVLRATSWNPGVGPVDLGHLGGDHGIATAVNGSGLIVGYSSPSDPSQYRHAFLHDGNGMIDLGTFGGIASRAYDINERGQVVGDSWYDDGDPWDSRIRAMLWLPEPAYGLPAGINDIDDFSTVLQQTSSAEAINEHGQVAGWLTWINELGQSVVQFGIWLPEPAYGLPAGWTDLRGLNGERMTMFAQDINDRGEVVFRGVVDDTVIGGLWSALRWYQGEWVDLHDCIPPADQAAWAFTAARAINEAGQISGTGFHYGDLHAFLLTPDVDDDGLPCPADLNEDGVIDVSDLIDVILNWQGCGPMGGGSCAGDINNDNQVDVLDMLEVILGWGPCPGDAEGVCCFPATGGCEDATGAECEFLGGTWQSGTCETVICPAPVTGACCFYPSGDCTDGLTEIACTFIENGTWQGAGSSCATTECPVPAVGDTIENPFTVTGIPFSTNGSTVGFLNEYDEICNFTAAAPDVVYAYTATRTEYLSVSTCGNSAYDTKIFVYENSVDNAVACNEDACETVNFPYPFVARIDFVEVTAGNTYYIVVDGWGYEAGFYTLDIDVAAVGACCLPDASCELWDEPGCIALGGIWQGDGVDCDASTCGVAPAGACCWAGGCIENVNEFDCTSLFSGTWQGAGTECAGVTCP